MIMPLKAADAGTVSPKMAAGSVVEAGDLLAGLELDDPSKARSITPFQGDSLGLEEALACESDRLLGADLLLAQAGATHRSHQEHSYLARSRYEQQLARYERRFSKNQLLLLKSEDLFERQAVVWQRVLNFLELDPLPCPEGTTPANAGRGESADVPETLRLRLRELLQSTYRVMEKRYGITWSTSQKSAN